MAPNPIILRYHFGNQSVPEAPDARRLWTVCSLFDVDRMSEPLELIPSDNDSSDSNSDDESKRCKIFICSKKRSTAPTSAPGKQSADKVRYTQHARR